jgi:hypothetical protein
MISESSLSGSRGYLQRLLSSVPGPEPWIPSLDYGSGSCSFRQGLSRYQQKAKSKFFSEILLLISFCRYVYICPQR